MYGHAPSVVWPPHYLARLFNSCFKTGNVFLLSSTKYSTCNHPEHIMNSQFRNSQLVKTVSDWGAIYFSIKLFTGNSVPCTTGYNVVNLVKNSEEHLALLARDEENYESMRVDYADGQGSLQKSALVKLKSIRINCNNATKAQSVYMSHLSKNG